MDSLKDRLSEKRIGVGSPWIVQIEDETPQRSYNSYVVKLDDVLAIVEEWAHEAIKSRIDHHNGFAGQPTHQIRANECRAVFQALFGYVASDLDSPLAGGADVK